MAQPPKHAPFRNRWVLYYHDSENMNWDISSYTVIMRDIHDPEQLVAINETIPEVIIKNAMLFVMKQGVSPMWEHPQHRAGGYISLKVPNKLVHSVWKTLFYGLCGETIFRSAEANAEVSGISISSKNLFCIIKIWMTSCSHRDAEIVRIPQFDVGETKFTPFTETKDAKKAEAAAASGP